MVVEGYLTAGADGRPDGAAGATKRWRIATRAEERGRRLATIIDEHFSPDRTAPGSQLSAALSRVQPRDIDGIVVTNLAHLASSHQDALSAIELILAAGGVFASIDDRLDVSTAAGRQRYQCLRQRLNR